MPRRPDTANAGDSYAEEFISAWLPKGWLRNIQGHACYRPGQVRPALPPLSPLTVREPISNHTTPHHAA